MLQNRERWLNSSGNNKSVVFIHANNYWYYKGGEEKYNSYCEKELLRNYEADALWKNKELHAQSKIEVPSKKCLNKKMNQVGKTFC